MEIAILQTIEEFTSMMGNKYGIYLIEINDEKQVISRNNDKFYKLTHNTEEDKLYRVWDTVSKEILILLGE